MHTDESRLYFNAADTFTAHETVHHTSGEYVRYEDGRAIHTNSAEGYFSIFKRGMRGNYQHCKEKHLHRYLAEFDFRYNHRVKLGYQRWRPCGDCREECGRQAPHVPSTSLKPITQNPPRGSYGGARRIGNRRSPSECAIGSRASLSNASNSEKNRLTIDSVPADNRTPEWFPAIRPAGPAHARPNVVRGQNQTS